MEVIVNKKKRRKEQRENKNNNKLRGSSSTPRTRSQLSPEWTTKEALILVNEIAAVEKDCLKALSTYQKWKIIVDNCVVLDVARNLNQCRTKWNSLLNEYNLIKDWDKESESRSDLYWSLESERRKEFGLPENFNEELFRAIDDYMWCHKEHPDTDPDPDPDTDPEKPDLLHAITNLGTKKQRWRSKSQKTCKEEKTHKCCGEDNSQTIHAEEKPQVRCVEENSQIYCIVEKPEGVRAEEEHQESQVQESTQTYYAEGKLQTIPAEEDPQESCAEEEPHTIHAEEEPGESPAEEHPQPYCSKEKPRTIHLEEETQERYLEENHQTCCANEKPHQSVPAETQHQESHVLERPQKRHRKEKSQNAHGDEKPKVHRGHKKKMPSTEEMEQMMVEKLRENAEMIQTVVNGNFPELADLEAADSKNIEGFKTDLIRSQGDKLIACLQNIVNSISQFPCLLQECD
ncbi:hypothetical protein OIU76_008580 [Salix suchowensis]|nr:hypothetical protein OIU76_008580 [Salix suchowensis]KAJ6361133.1 hypothetical protein OIU78_001719 [Salix suchowensis]